MTCSDGYATGNGNANDNCDGNAIHPVTCAGLMLMIMLIVLGMPMVTLMPMLIAMVMLMLLGHSKWPFTLNLWQCYGDGNATRRAVGASCHSPYHLWELDAS